MKQFLLYRAESIQQLKGLFMRNALLYLFFHINWECKVQGVPKLVLQKSADVTSELDVKIWSVMFKKLRIVVRFSFKPPDGIPLLQSEVTSYLNRLVVAWIRRGGTIALPPRSPDLTFWHRSYTFKF
jgi:hypothetical protein